MQTRYHSPGLEKRRPWLQLSDINPKLLEAELPAILIVDHLENDPLARCEWIKFVALFFGTEEHADNPWEILDSRLATCGRRNPKS